MRRGQTGTQKQAAAHLMGRGDRNESTPVPNPCNPFWFCANGRATSLSLSLAAGYINFLLMLVLLGTELSFLLKWRMALGVSVIFWFISHIMLCQPKWFGLHIYC
jgi:hypothetical protein